MTDKKDQPENHTEVEQTELDLESFTLETALARLEEIVDLMDSESIELERSIELFQEGMRLTQFCQNQISDAEQKVMKVVEDSKGDITLEDFGHEQD
ncbi:MAG TPA: exodeoxyribonuclease VII small subunit [Gammaproteobacteria bacterium]|nr:exodeoxyribonuclease VII small subunit [Gammaproteobacteria bacterium]